MHGIRVLVAGDYVELRKSIAEHLLAQEDVTLVREAGDGEEALTLLSELCFDVVVTDLIMPKMDGYMMLETMRHMNLTPMPKTVVVTALKRDDLVMRAVDLGVSYYLPKPISLDNLTVRVRELAHIQPSFYNDTVPAARSQTLDERLGKLFLTIGMPANIKGFHYLRDGVKMVVQNPNVINRITKELYPDIASLYTTSASRVERAIRHAITLVWNRGRVERLNKLLGCKVCTLQDRPSNGEFIAMLAEKFSPEYPM